MKSSREKEVLTSTQDLRQNMIREKELLTSTQDLRQNMIREKVPLQGIGDGVSRQWCLVVDFKLLPVLCSAPVPSCYRKLSIKSDTQSTLWPWCLWGNKDIWGKRYLGSG